MVVKISCHEGQEIRQKNSPKIAVFLGSHEGGNNCNALGFGQKSVILLLIHTFIYHFF